MKFIDKISDGNEIGMGRAKCHFSAVVSYLGQKSMDLPISLLFIFFHLDMISSPEPESDSTINQRQLPTKPSMLFKDKFYLSLNDKLSYPRA